MICRCDRDDHIVLFPVTTLKGSIMSIAEEEKKKVRDALILIDRAVAWLLLDMKDRKYDQKTLSNISWCIKDLYPHTASWKKSNLLRASAENCSHLLRDDLKFSSEDIVVAFVLSVPYPHHERNNVQVNQGAFAWSEDNAKNAEYFVHLLTRLEDSLDKLFFAQYVIKLAKNQNLEGCVGACFTREEAPWGHQSTELEELWSFIRRFAKEVDITLS